MLVHIIAVVPLDQAIQRSRNLVQQNRVLCLKYFVAKSFTKPVRI